MVNLGYFMMFNQMPQLIGVQCVEKFKIEIQQAVLSGMNVRDNDPILGIFSAQCRGEFNSQLAAGPGDQDFFHG